MNSAKKIALSTVLILSAAGCAQKKTTAVPAPQAQAPSIDAGKAGALYPPPLVPAQTRPAQPETPPAAVAQTDVPPPPPPPEPKPKKPASKKAKPAPSKGTPGSTTGSGDASDTTPSSSAPASTATPAQTQADNEIAAASGEPAAASPIGKLSTGGSASQSQTQKTASDLINSTESAVSGMKRTLSPQEQETITQIKTFLQKAQKALENEDYDGANTLATKAKVLLDELNKD